MRKLLSGLATGLMMLGITSGDASALSVTATNSGLDLVNAIVGSGITVTPGSISYTGESAASGTFTNGGNIGIASGILLTTGNATGAVGPNNTGAYDGDGVASSLGFSFTSSGGDLFFDYVFASEEYNEYVNSAFNDTFSFLLDGVNIALIPSTVTAVSINNVNLELNSAYYRNNSPGSFDTQYDGLTTVLTAQALGLGAGSHTILMTISDVGDSALDSGVFIKGNSFSDNSTNPVPEPTTMILFGTGIAGLIAVRRKKKAC